MSDRDEVEHTIAENSVVSKYKMVGQIVNGILSHLISLCVNEASARNICIEGDRLMVEETGKVFKKRKDIKRGIAFPTCVSINNCINHFSPLHSDTDVILADGDLVKLDFGAHIDGFIGVVAHTVVVGASKENKVTGRQADVMLAAFYASQAALKLVKPGNENYTVTDTVTKIAESFNCKPVEGMLSFQLSQGNIVGEKKIAQNPTESQRKEIEKKEFETHEVYGVDVIISTGEGQGREMDSRVTVFRKTDEVYNLKLKASRELYSKISRNYGSMPFNLRSFDDEKKARLGIVECISHKLVDPYPVLWEKPKEFVAQFKFTLLLMPSGPLKVTGLPVDENAFDSECSIEDAELKGLLKSSAKKNAKQKRRKASGQAVATSVSSEDM